MTRNNLIKM